MQKRQILFVCNGNVHRSVIAALCAQKLLNERGFASEYAVHSRGLKGSAGTEPPPYPHLRHYDTEWKLTSVCLKEIGITMPETHRSRPITRADIERASLVLAMDRLVLQELPNSLLRQFPERTRKIRLFSELADRKHDVPDPRGSADAELHRRVVHTINDTLCEYFVIMLNLAT